ncbi:MAG: transcriptional repressor [Deltaproteobacteria bacterium]|nr:transcriptional repressor [Deltaproteobacteria bacterium]
MVRSRDNAAQEALRARIRAAGLRVTAPRVAVLQRMELARSPVSHGELSDALSPAWDRATIYRNLMDLTESGLLRRTDLGDHIWRFELASVETLGHEAPQHAHFVCRTCGEVQCLPSESVQLQLSRTAPKSVRAQSVEIQLKGLCERCT